MKAEEPVTDLSDLAGDEAVDLTSFAIPRSGYPNRITAGDVMDPSIMPRLPARVALARKARKAKLRAERLQNALSKLLTSEKEH